MGYSPWNHKTSDMTEHKARTMTFINMKGNLDLVSQANDISFHYSLNFILILVFYFLNFKIFSDLSVFQNQQDLSYINKFKFSFPVT